MVENPAYPSSLSYTSPSLERFGGEGIYSMGRIVEEPEAEEEEDHLINPRKREASVAPVSPRALSRAGLKQATSSPTFPQQQSALSQNGPAESGSVPIPATRYALACQRNKAGVRSSSASQSVPCQGATSRVIAFLSRRNRYSHFKFTYHRDIASDT